jgi:putative SOS response-associated peptidase YedK
MPVLLHPDHHELWLSDLTHDGLLRSLMQPVPAGTLEAFPVSNRVNSTRENDASLVLPKVE